MNPIRRFCDWYAAKKAAKKAAREQRQAETLAAFCKLVVSIGSRLTEEDLANAKRIVE